MLKHTLTAAALATVLATPAFAQKQPAPDTNKQQTQATPDKGMNKDMKSGSQGAMSNHDQKGMAEKKGMSDNKGMAEKKNGMSEKSATADKSDKSDMTAKDTGKQQAGFIQQQEANEWRASKLIGASVYGPDDKSIGDINEVLLDKEGRVTAVVVGVGGFLGIGEKNVALPFQSLEVQREPKDNDIEKIRVSYTKDQLKQAPKFAYYEGGQAETTGSQANESAGKPMAHEPKGADKSDSKMAPNNTGKPDQNGKKPQKQ